MMTAEYPKTRTLPGSRWRLKHDVERFPHFIAKAGSTGTIDYDDGDAVYLKMDEYLDGAEEWDNCIQWMRINNGDNPLDDIEPEIIPAADPAEQALIDEYSTWLQARPHYPEMSADELEAQIISDCADWPHGASDATKADVAWLADFCTRWEAMRDHQDQRHGGSKAARSSIFDSHRCWKCDDGAKPCVRGSPNRCEYPHALND